MNKNNLDKFESMMKDALNSHQETFVPSSWDALEKRLPKTKTPLYKSPWLWGVAALIGTVLPLSIITLNETKVEDNEKIIVDSSVVSNSEMVDGNSLNKGSTNETLETFVNNEVSKVFNEVQVNEYQTNTVNGVGNPIKGTSSETIPNSSNLTETTPKENVTSTSSSLSNFSQNGGKGIEVQVAKPTAEFSSSMNEICEGNAVSFATDKQENVDYLWSFGDGTYSKDQNPKHTFSKSGSFVVSLIVRSTVDNSILTKATDDLIVVNPMPKVEFSFELKENQGIPMTSFINLTDKGYKWNWNTGDGTIYSSKDPDHLYYKKGKYHVTLTVENEFGCTKAYTKPVDINEDYNLLAPNSFTPNGDGINDFFIPEALKVMDVQFTMTIISINEGVIFQTNSLSNPWNGNNQRTGSLCGEGTYKWVVTFVNSQGKTEQFTGAVLLLK